jgi:hypothetical protein
MIEQATVDAYKRVGADQGLVHDDRWNFAVPFETTVLGVPVTVERLDLNRREKIVAVCTRGRSRQSLPIRYPRRRRTARSGSRHLVGGVRKDDALRPTLD